MISVILIEEDGVLLEQSGTNKYEIHSLIVKKEAAPDAIYTPDTSFFKAVCQSGTRHKADMINDTLVNIF